MLTAYAVTIRRTAVSWLVCNVFVGEQQRANVPTTAYRLAAAAVALPGRGIAASFRLCVGDMDHGMSTRAICFCGVRHRRPGLHRLAWLCELEGRATDATGQPVAGELAELSPSNGAFGLEVLVLVLIYVVT